MAQVLNISVWHAKRAAGSHDDPKWQRGIRKSKATRREFVCSAELPLSPPSYAAALATITATPKWHK